MVTEKALNQFVREANQNIDIFQSDLLRLEKEFQDVNLLQSMYRNMHTIKGSAGFLSFTKIEALVHKTEDIFNTLTKQSDTDREKVFSDKELINIFFELSDEVTKHIKSIKEFRQELEREPEHLLDRLNAIYISLNSNAQQEKSERKKSKRKLSAMQLKALEKLKTETSKSSHEITKVEIKEDIYVKEETLDTLSSINSELVQARNQLSSLIDERDIQMNTIFNRISSLSQRMSKRIAQVRMQPISHFSDQLKRYVRELSNEFNKKVELNIIGESIEADRTVLNVLKDCLVQIIRNSVDHGIESPEQRKEKSKKEIASISIEVKYRDNRLVVTISDDGSGLDNTKILEKAIAKGLIAQAQAETMDENDINNLIFIPGFSTAEKVSSVSGRGVGMDIVMSEITKIGGSIEVYSKDGLGTTFDLSLPFNLAIGSVVIVEIDKQKFAIPLENIKELHSAYVGDIGQDSQIAIRSENYQLYPGQFITQGGVKSLSIKELEKSYRADEKFEMLILEANHFNFALKVDNILDRQDIVIKSLPSFCNELDLYSGSTILANGDIALILDIEKLMLKINQDDDQIIETHQPNELKSTRLRNFDRLMSFALGDKYFAIEYSVVKEVIVKKKLVPIPGAKSKSLMKLRDSIVLAKNIKDELSLSQSKSRHDIGLLIDANDKSMVFQVDDINEIVEISENTEEVDFKEEAFADYILKAYEVNGKKIFVIDELAFLRN